MLTILLTLILWVVLNTIAQHDIKTNRLTVTATPAKVKTVKKRQTFTPEHIHSINLLELLP